MFSKLNNPANGTSSKDQNTVRIAMTKVMDHALNILVVLERYVCCHTTSEGAGARFATNFIGSGSIRAWTAIC